MGRFWLFMSWCKVLMFLGLVVCSECSVMLVLISGWFVVVMCCEVVLIYVVLVVKWCWFLCRFVCLKLLCVYRIGSSVSFRFVYLVVLVSV